MKDQLENAWASPQPRGEVYTSTPAQIDSTLRPIAGAPTPSDYVRDLLHQTVTVEDASTTIMEKLTDRAMPLENPAKKKQKEGEEVHKRLAKARRDQYVHYKRTSRKEAREARREKLAQEGSNPKKMNRRDRKRLEKETYAASADQWTYSMMEGLHSLWLQYAEQLMQHCKCDHPAKQDLFLPHVAKMDLHGAALEVIRASNPMLVGLKGIVAKETQYTFLVITAENTRKTVMKRNAVFLLHMKPPFTFQLFGNAILCRIADRSVRKFKAKTSIDL